MTPRGLAREVEVDEDVVERRRPRSERPLHGSLERALVEEQISVRGLESQRGVEAARAQQRERRGPECIQGGFEGRERRQALSRANKERIGHVSALVLRRATSQ